MATHRVTAPVPNYVGSLNGIPFVDGVAEMDETVHRAELAYCRTAGYTVEEIGAEEPPAAADVDGDGVPEVLPRRNASVDTWRKFAVEHGMTQDEAHGLSRDDLVAHFSKGDSK